MKDLLAGLTLMPHQSGEVVCEEGINKAGNRLVRGMAVEIARGWSEDLDRTLDGVALKCLRARSVERRIGCSAPRRGRHG